jgi:hypothetical protein
MGYFQEPASELRVNEELRRQRFTHFGRYGFGGLIRAQHGLWVRVEGMGARMIIHQDYSFVFGVVSAVMGLCILLTVWYLAKGSRKTHHSRLRRQWRKQ